jgi:hypothetical protein
MSGGDARTSTRRRFLRWLRLAGLVLILTGGASSVGLAGEVIAGTGTGAGSFPNVIEAAYPNDEVTFSGQGNSVALSSAVNIAVNSSSTELDGLNISGNKSGTLLNLTSIGNLTAKIGNILDDNSFYMQAMDSMFAALEDPAVTFPSYASQITTAISNTSTGGATLTTIGRDAVIGPSAVSSLGTQNLFRWQQQGTTTKFPDGLAIKNIHFNGYDFTGDTSGGLTSTHSMIGPANPIDETSTIGQTISSVDGNWFDGRHVSMTVTNGGNSMVPALFTLRAGNANASGNIVPGTDQMEFTIDNVSGNLFDNVKVNVNGNLNGAGWFGTSFGVFSSYNTATSYTINAVHNINKIAGNVFLGDSTDDDTITANNIQGSGIAGIRIDIDYDTQTGTGTGTITSTGKGIIGELSGNLFDSLKINATNQINGAGLVGVYVAAGSGISNDSIAEITNIGGNPFSGSDGNVFSNINVNAGSGGIKGGGLIAVQGNHSDGNSTTGVAAEIGAVNGNVFYNNRVISGGGLFGGGVIGVNSDGNNATLGNATVSDFESGTVHFGGVIGNLFEDVKVTISGDIQGGGVMAVNSNSTNPDHQSYLGSTNGYGVMANIFNNIDITAGGAIAGGGIIAANAGKGDGTTTIVKASVAIGTVFGNFFNDINVVSKGNFTGGGIIGTHSVTSMENLADAQKYVEANFFRDVKVGVGYELSSSRELVNPTSGINLYGGGLIGARTDDGLATIGNIGMNHFVSDNEVKVTGNLVGGGFIGVSAENATLSTDVIASIAGIDSIYYNGSEATNTWEVDVGGFIYGGGIFGAAGTKTSSQGTITARLGEVSNSQFIDVGVKSGTYILGGGLIGAASDGNVEIGKFSNNIFALNTVEAGTYIAGGGLIAAVPDLTSGTTGAVVGGVHFEDNYFESNIITANNGAIKGGLIYAYGLPTGGAELKNSVFLDNIFTATKGTWGGTDGATTNARMYGVFGIDTAIQNGTGGTSTLNVVAENWGSVKFGNNDTDDDYSRDLENNDPAYYTITNAYANSATGLKPNGKKQAVSLYFGAMPVFTTSSGTQEVEVALGTSTENAALNIDVKERSTVELYDPIRVEQNNDQHFNMNITTFATGTLPMSYGGYFRWGGDNIISLKGNYSNGNQNPANNIITFKSGDSYLMEAFKLRSDYAVDTSYADAGVNPSVVTDIGIRDESIDPITGIYSSEWRLDTPITGDTVTPGRGNNNAWDRGITGGAFNVHLGSTTTTATLYVPVQETYDPRNVPEIIADTFSGDAGSKIDLDYEGRFFPSGTDLATGNTVLRLEETKTVEDATRINIELGKGILMFGAYDVEYTLVWDGDNDWTGVMDVGDYAGQLVRAINFEGDSLNPDARFRNVILMRGSRNYNPQRGGDDTIPPPLRVVTTNVGPREVHDRAREWFGDAWQCAPKLDECGRPIVEECPPPWCDDPCQRITAWARASVDYAGARGGALGSLSLVNPGVTVGMDYASPQNEWLVGIAVGQSFPNYRGDRVELKGYDVTALAYGALRLRDGFELSGYAGAGRTWFDQKREVPNPSTGNLIGRFSSRHDTWSLLAGAELLWRRDIDRRRSWFPFIGYDFRELFNQGYAEKATGDDVADKHRLKIDRYNQSFHQLRLGAGMDWLTERGTRLRGDLFYRARLGDVGGETKGAFAGENFAVKHRISGAAMARHAVGAEFGASIPLSIRNRNASLDLVGRAALSLDKREWELGGMATLSISF